MVKSINTLVVVFFYDVSFLLEFPTRHGETLSILSSFRNTSAVQITSSSSEKLSGCPSKSFDSLTLFADGAGVVWVRARILTHLLVRQNRSRRQMLASSSRCCWLAYFARESRATERKENFIVLLLVFCSQRSADVFFSLLLVVGLPLDLIQFGLSCFITNGWASRGIFSLKIWFPPASFFGEAMYALLYDWYDLLHLSLNSLDALFW